MGDKFYGAIDAIRSAGDDPQKLLQLAGQLSGLTQPVQQQTQAPQQQQQTQAAPTPAEQANAERQQSFLQESLQAAQHNPSSGGAAVANPPGQDPGEMTEQELKTLFVRRYQQDQAVA